MTKDEHDKNSYKESLKATSLFGGVQVYNILIGIIRSKFVAVLLGPVGMGINGLLISATDLIISLTNLGLGTSAVRDIAEANATQDAGRIALVIRVFRRLVWLTGLLGAVICFLSSPYLSYVTFGNYEYTIAFVILSSSVLFKQLATGQTALLQGMLTAIAHCRRIRRIPDTFYCYFINENSVTENTHFNEVCDSILAYSDFKHRNLFHRHIDSMILAQSFAALKLADSRILVLYEILKNIKIETKMGELDGFNMKFLKIMWNYFLLPALFMLKLEFIVRKYLK